MMINKLLLNTLLIHSLVCDEGFNQVVLDSRSRDDRYCQLAGLIKDSRCDFQTVETINDKLIAPLANLCSTSFFSHYKLHLNKQCPFWTEHHLCNEPGCEVSKCPTANLPAAWRNQGLGAIETALPNNNAGFGGDIGGGMGGFGNNNLLGKQSRCTFTEKDYCVLEDEEDDEGVYVNLLDNPERYTGYAGASAARVWSAIYEENCYEFLDTLNDTKLAQDDIEGTYPQVTQVLEKLSLTNNTLSTSYLSQLPTEKRIFYKLISGLHASISTHLCYKKLDKTTNTWGPDLNCFIDRLGSHPDRLENMYFNYVLLLRAVSKMAKYLQGYSYCDADPEENKFIQQVMTQVVQVSKSCPPTFDEKDLFNGVDAPRLKYQFKHHFRNISRIMDCVGCEKCRLWGKIQTSGLGTALKILFEYETKTLNPVRNPHLFQKTEIVSLINTFTRLSESIQAIESFRVMYHDRLQEQETPKPSISETATMSTPTPSATAKPMINFTDFQLSLQSMITNVSVIVYRQTVDLAKGSQKLFVNRVSNNPFVQTTTDHISNTYRNIVKYLLRR